MKHLIKAIFMALFIITAGYSAYGQNVYNSVSQITDDDEYNDVTINANFTIVGFGAHVLLYDGSNYLFVSECDKFESLGAKPGNTFHSITGNVVRTVPKQISVLNKNPFCGEISSAVSPLPSPTVLSSQSLSFNLSYVEAKGTVIYDDDDKQYFIKTSGKSYPIMTKDFSEPTEFVGQEAT